MDVEEKYPALDQLLSLRFHQDWGMLYASETDAVMDHVNKRPGEVPRLLAELDALLAEGLSEEALDDVLTKLGANYYAPGVGKTYRQWTRWLRDEVHDLAYEELTPLRR